MFSELTREDIKPALRYHMGNVIRKIEANNHKGSHVGLGIGYLVAKMVEEVGELMEAIAEEDWENAVMECGDVTAYAAFVSDNIRRKYLMDVKR